MDPTSNLMCLKFSPYLVLLFSEGLSHLWTVCGLAEVSSTILPLLLLRHESCHPVRPLSQRRSRCCASLTRVD